MLLRMILRKIERKKKNSPVTDCSNFVTDCQGLLTLEMLQSV